MSIYDDDHPYVEPIEQLDNASLAYQLGVQDREWHLMPSGIKLTYEVHSEAIVPVHVAVATRRTIVELDDVQVGYGRLATA